MILITGAGGSVGLGIIDTLLRSNKAIIAIDSSKNACENLKGLYGKDKNLSVLELDINDSRLGDYFVGVEKVIHLAATKNIVDSETEISKTISDNIIGLKSVLDLSIKSNVKYFVFSSSDKAANPKSVLGASKLLGEKLVTEYAIKHQKTYYSIRYGNILGSSGSVMPIVISQIKNGDLVTVTDTAMTRFVITLHDAVQIVFQLDDLNPIGDVFIKKMPSIKIFDLIHVLWDKFHAHGSKVEYKIVGSRKNEKVHEELFSLDECENIVEDENFFVIKPEKQKGAAKQRLFEKSCSLNQNQLSREEIYNLIYPKQ